MADDFCLIHDDRLGYAPKPGFRGVGAGGWPVTIDADGFRRGAAGGAGEPCVEQRGGSALLSALRLTFRKSSFTPSATRHAE